MMHAAVRPASTALRRLYSLLALGFADSGSRDGVGDAVTSKLESQTRFARAGVDRSSRLPRHADMFLRPFRLVATADFAAIGRSTVATRRRQSEEVAAPRRVVADRHASTRRPTRRVQVREV